MTTTTTSTRSAVDVRDSLNAIRHIVHQLRVSSRAAEAEAGVSGAQLFVLQRLAATHGLSMSDLAAQTFTHVSSVSVVVARLVEAGLVRRARSKSDARRAVLTITPSGRLVVRRAPWVAQDQLIGAIATLPAGQRKVLATALTLVARAMGMREGPPLFFEEGAPKAKRPASAR